MGSNNNIQETKLVVIDDYILCQLLGTGFDYAFLPAANTRGGGYTGHLESFRVVGFVHLDSYLLSLG
jgi:hypothetical protein